jgi:hypothetical protein
MGEDGQGKTKMYIENFNGKFPISLGKNQKKMSS